MIARRIPDKVVAVTGDVAMDWNLAHVPRRRDGLLRSATDDTVRTYRQRGGAALLADLIEAVAESLHERTQANWTVRETAAPREPIHPGDERFVHSYAMWSLHKYREQQPRETKAWRVEEYLGYDRLSSERLCTPEDWKRVTDDTAEATLFVTSSVPSALGEMTLGETDTSYSNGRK